jgi:hypothetical protein
MFFVISDKTIGAMYQITRRYTPEDSKLETPQPSPRVSHNGHPCTEQLTRRHNPQDRILNLNHLILLRQLDISMFRLYFVLKKSQP